ncbi:MAG: hypothetical protein KDB05_19185 [Planctomycetales bacterium]|nr:hypothetical protein [Planctomycetales bacterium]
MNELNRFEQASYTTDYLGDGVRYRLPHRTLGRARHLGWFGVGAGMMLSLFMIAWMSGPVLGGIDDLKKGGEAAWFSIAFGCFGLIGLVPGIGLVLGGFAVTCNRTRCEIEIRGGKIAVKERFFLARMRRSCETSGIRTLRVADANERTGGSDEHNTRVWLGDSDTALLAKTGGKKEFLIAAAYPRELLTKLAEELAPKLEADLSVISATIKREPAEITEGELTPRKIAIVEGLVNEEQPPPVPDQPTDSLATITRRDDGITIEIPPAGLWKGSKGLFVFALLWNAFVSIFLVVGVLAAFGQIEVDGDGPPWIMALVAIVFLAIGSGIMLAAVNMGRRHATIATADDLVMIVRHSIFGKTTREWSASQIDKICCGNSGMEVNDVPVRELQIIPIDDKKFGCLSQLDDSELDWIAAEINQALGIHRPADRGERRPAVIERDSRGWVIAPRNSRITLDRTIEGLQINVPPVGVWKYLGLVVFGIFFAAIGVGIAFAVGWDAVDNGFRRRDIGDLLFAGVFLLGFGGSGTVITLVGLVAGRRRFQLQVEHDELTLVRRGPFLRKTFRWHRDDLDSVSVKDSGTQVNNRSLYHVFIQSRKSDSIGIMTGHDSADLDFVATAVKESLGLLDTDTASA